MRTALGLTTNAANTFSGGLYLTDLVAALNGARITNPGASTGTPGALTAGPLGTGIVYIGQNPLDKARHLL